jgi:transcriptional regulator of met regulon
MKNFDTTKIMNNYTEAERKEIIFVAMMMQNTGAPAPQNEEEFKDFCEKVINERKKAERKEAEKQARKEAREMQNVKL